MTHNADSVCLIDVPWNGRKCAGCQQPLGKPHKADCSLVAYRGAHNDCSGGEK